jgi:trimethylamine--corrinoid protein Co-methyltransferase
MGKEYYNLPTRSLCGMSDAKTIDCQAGFESMASALTSILSGTDMIAEAMGCLESFMATSYEKFIIDEEIIERALCIKKGLDARLRAYMEKN